MTLNPFPTRNTERLILRKIDLSDADTILFLRSDKTINKFIQRPAERQTKDMDDALKFIQNINEARLKNESISWGICLKNNPEIVGTICLWNFSKDLKTAEVGYDLIPKFQGRGIMNEALIEVLDFGFNTLDFSKIEAFTHNENKPSIQLLKKNNFKLMKQRRDIDNAKNLIFEIEKIEPTKAF